MYIWLMDYIWQQENFPDFSFQKEKLIPVIEQFTLNLGELNGLFQNFEKETKLDIFTEVMLAEAIKTSEIEGEFFSREDVMSSLKANLGIKSYHRKTRSKKANSIAKLMIAVQKSYKIKLTSELLLGWHKILMENEEGVNAGTFRKGKDSMQVISGKFGKIQVHYEAPPSKDLPKMSKDFIKWYHSFKVSDMGKIGEAMVFSALVHLYFETLHPFEDGNGRIGRALAEKALAEKLEIPIFLSISNSIEKDKKKYYSELKKAQQNMQITRWLMYFCTILNDALLNSKKIAAFTLKKTSYFDRYKNQFNERELKAIQKMMITGEEEFQGGLTAKKYISINKTSKATATRDLQHLAEIGALKKEGGGRSVSYKLNFSK